MSKFKTRIYQDWTGVHYDKVWRSREHYLAGRRFLEDLLGGPASTIGGYDFFVLDTEQQLDALLAFRRKLGYGRP